jgi:hypothetical protein
VRVGPRRGDDAGRYAEQLPHTVTSRKDEHDVTANVDGDRPEEEPASGAPRRPDPGRGRPLAWPSGLAGVGVASAATKVFGSEAGLVAVLALAVVLLAVLAARR